MSTGIKPDGEKIEVDIPQVGRPACANCAFAIAQVDGASNKVVSIECRRFAPRPGQLAAWPGVLPDDWCGMYMSRGEFAEGERAKREAFGAMRLIRDTFAQLPDGGDEPGNLNG